MQRVGYWLCVYVPLAVVLTLTHVYFVDGPSYAAQRKMHERILRRGATRPYSIKVLQPVVVEACVSHVAWADPKTRFLAAYAAFRLASLLVTFIAFETFLSRLGALGAARAVVTLLAAFYPLGYVGYYYQPTSVLDLAFFAVGLVVIAGGPRWVLLPLLVLATANRNTSVFIVGAYALWRGAEVWDDRRALWRVAGASVGLFLCWLACVWCLERTYSGSGWTSLPSGLLNYNLTHLRVWLLAGIMMLPLAAGVAFAWTPSPRPCRWVLLLAVPYFAVHLLMAQCDEPRYWLPLYVLAGPFLAQAWTRLHAGGSDPAPPAPPPTSLSSP